MSFDIVSKENAKIKYVKKLAFNENFRKRERYFTAEGLRLMRFIILTKRLRNSQKKSMNLLVMLNGLIVFLLRF